MAATHRIPTSRVDEVLGLVGLDQVARKRAGGFSLGMGQRLGIASALLGDPATLLLDEPVNGLDPEGILWVRTLLRQLAAEGRTVFVSSHLMSEMALTAEQLIVVGRGRLIASGTVAELVQTASRDAVLVRTPETGRLAELLGGRDVGIERREPDTLIVTGLDSAQIGLAAARESIALVELTPQRATLEEAFMEITRESVEYHGTSGAPPAVPAGVGSGS
jgi:ABC-2 type transport system ATP-binding protein